MLFPPKVTFFITFGGIYALKMSFNVSVFVIISLLYSFVFKPNVVMNVMNFVFLDFVSFSNSNNLFFMFT